MTNKTSWEAWAFLIGVCALVVIVIGGLVYGAFKLRNFSTQVGTSWTTFEAQPGITCVLVHDVGISCIETEVRRDNTYLRPSERVERST